MFLSRRKGIWYLWYADESGIRRKVSARTSKKSAAYRFRHSFKPSAEHSSPTLSESVDRLVMLKAVDYSPGTPGIYR
jgi:hypothetical protein